MTDSATVARADRRSSRQRGPATREDIHVVALDLFARLGYHATSMRAIAAAAGIQPAAIYHWYPSKEALLVHLQDDFMDRLTEKLEAAMAAEERPALKLAAAVREHVVFHGLNTRAAFVTDSEIRALRPEAKKRLIAQRDAYQDIFIGADRRRDARRLVPGVEPEGRDVLDASRLHRGRTLVQPRRLTCA